jgi:hypothetical protein
MKHVQSFQQYERVSYSNYDSVNEGIMDTFKQNSSKIKNYIKTKLFQMSPEKVNRMKQEMIEFKDMSFGDIKAKVQASVRTSESRVYEYSEPHSDNWGRPSVNSYRKGLTLSELINRVLTGGIVIGVITLVINWISVDLFKHQFLSDAFLGITVLVMFASAIIWLFKNALFTDD